MFFFLLEYPVKKQRQALLFRLLYLFLWHLSVFFFFVFFEINFLPFAQCTK